MVKKSLCFGELLDQLLPRHLGPALRLAVLAAQGGDHGLQPAGLLGRAFALEQRPEALRRRVQAAVVADLVEVDGLELASQGRLLVRLLERVGPVLDLRVAGEQQLLARRPRTAGSRWCCSSAGRGCGRSASSWSPRSASMRWMNQRAWAGRCAYWWRAANGDLPAAVKLRAGGGLEVPELRLVLRPLLADGVGLLKVGGPSTVTLTPGSTSPEARVAAERDVACAACPWSSGSSTADRLARLSSPRKASCASDPHAQLAVAAPGLVQGRRGEGVHVGQRGGEAPGVGGAARRPGRVGLRPGVLGPRLDDDLGLRARR